MKLIKRNNYSFKYFKSNFKPFIKDLILLQKTENEKDYLLILKKEDKILAPRMFIVIDGRMQFLSINRTFQSLYEYCERGALNNYPYILERLKKQ